MTKHFIMVSLMALIASLALRLWFFNALIKPAVQPIGEES